MKLIQQNTIQFATYELLNLKSVMDAVSNSSIVDDDIREYAKNFIKELEHKSG